MKLWLTWFSLLLAFSYCCAQFYPTEYDVSYEESLNQEEESTTEMYPEAYPSSGHYRTLGDEDTTFFEDWFSTTVSVEEIVTLEANISEVQEEMGTLSEMPSYNVEEDDDWYPDEMESKLRIEYTPYSALLYQEDEFGLEFLCPGYWLRKRVLLIRGDFWPKDAAFNIDDTVEDIFPNNDLNLVILLLKSNVTDSEEPEELHLASVREHMPVSAKNCALYVLQEDYALFEMYSWAIRPLPFKPARAFCRENHICLRTRPSAAYGLDYALICDRSLVGMLTTERTKYERVFGRITLVDLSVAKRWMDQILQQLDMENEAQAERVTTTFLSLSATPMPPAEMYFQQEGDTV